MLNKKGFSLAEVLTATGIATIGLAVLMSLYMTINSHFIGTRERFQAQATASHAEYLLRLIFSQAINLQSVASLPNNPGAGSGQIYNGINFPTIASAPGDWTTLAVFLREAAHLQGTGNGSLKQTAVWYRRPSATTSGVLFIDTGAAVAWPGGGVQPSYSDDYIDRISYLSIQVNTHPSYAPQVVSLDFHLRIRYHLDPSTGTNWCPQADIGVTAGCATKATWRDLDQTFSVVAHNNILHNAGALMTTSGVSSEERVLGNLFFFSPILPTK